MIRNPAEMLDEERMKDLLARNLERYMRKRGITQTGLAKLADIQKSTLNTYFTRKSFPGPDKLQAIADALEVGLEDLVPKIDREAIRTLIREPGEPEGGDEGALAHSLRALPGRPGFSRIMIRADLPTGVALQIMTLVLSVEPSPDPAPPTKGATSPDDVG